MKILCIYSVEDYASIDRPLAAFSSISFGISFVISACKNAGHEVQLFVATSHPKSIAHVIERIKKDRPQVIALTAVTSQYSLIKKIASRVKQISPEIIIILGGHHATLNPEATIQETMFDAICIGEGDHAVADFVDQLSRGNRPRDINNIWIKDAISGKVNRSPQSAFIQDLDSLPFVDRTLWENWVFDRNRMHMVLVGRGCPNKCAYCSNHVLSKTGSGRYVRFRSPESILAELESITRSYPEVSSIHLEAETLSVNLDYTIELCRAIEQFNSGLSHSISFGTNLSITRHIINNRDLLEAFKRANFEFINIGLESGSERVRNEVLKRPKYANDDIIAFSRSAREYGLQINIFALIGTPGETPADYRETIKCIRKCEPSHVFPSIFYPYPGTDLYESAKLQGLFTGIILNPEMERKKATLDLPGFSKKQIQREFVLFPYRVYRGKKPAAVIIAYVLQAFISFHPFLHRIYRFAIRHPLLRKLQKKIVPISK